jgi:transcription termination factor Rho
VLTRSALEASPLADLHAIASELSLDGYRRLRKADLIDRIIAQQGGEEAVAEEVTADDPVAEEVVAEVVAASADDEEEERPRRRRGGRGGRSRRRDEDPEAEAESEAESESEPDAEAIAEDDAGAEDEAVTDADTIDASDIATPRAHEDGVTDEDDHDRAPRSRRRSRGGRDRDRGGREDRNGREDRDAEREDRIVSGTIELLPNGSGFVRGNAAEPSDDDVYVSAAQVRRCELVTGDQVSGPVREPRRSERYPSLIRIDTINNRPADEVAEGTHFDDLPCTLPNERFALGSDDATLKAIEWLTPIGKGSRVTIVGEAHAGKSEVLKRLAGALHVLDGVEVHVVLAAVRPEECAEWRASELEPVAALSLAASADAQSQAVERAIDTAKRIAARGGDVVVLIDALDGLPQQAARRALAAARNVVDGGSLTLIATAAAPIGGETTIIALDRTLTRTGQFPALDVVNSGALRPELLVGDAGAEAIAQTRLERLGA